MVLYSKHKLFGNRCIFERALTVGVVIADRNTIAGSLGEANCSRNRNLEKLVRIVLFKLRNHLCSQSKASVIHCKQDSNDLKRGIIDLFNLFNGV